MVTKLGDLVLRPTTHNQAYGRLHSVSMLASEERSDCPPVSPLSMTRCFPELWVVTQRRIRRCARPPMSLRNSARRRGGVQKPFLASSKNCCSKNASLRHVLLELQERSSMEERRLGGRRDIAPTKLTLHARSPLATTRSPLTMLVTNQVTPGYWCGEPLNQGLGRSPLTRARKETAMNAILAQLHLSQNESIHWLT